MKRIIFFVLLVILLAISVGCGKEEAAPVVAEPLEDEQTEENSEKDEKDKAEPKFANVYPLTGIGTNEEVDQRTIAVMINNDPKARPQTGLQKADIVYEVLAEGNITRFLAIFQSDKPESIGPVRSARDYFINLSKGYDSIYISHGWSPEAQMMLQGNEVDYLQGLFHDGTLFKRADFRKAPHNSYITYESVWKGAEQKKYKTTHTIEPLSFLSSEEAASITGENGENVMIAYSTSGFSIVEYMYNRDTGKYERYSGEERTEDLESGEPVLLDNIFIVETSHKVVDSKGRRDIDLTSGGKGLLLQKGKVREVEWKNSNGRILPYLDGKEVGFVPGKTWINVVPSLSEDMVSFQVAN
ncbi:DUF3048 domain-containing protein [Bacillus salitolerans]|uniref:DUF3048 domain-containing protein n=1 Tax=Bacillus salitolerans TaxID=1437434 RepID=A0ABW4LS66_9BACI